MKRASMERASVKKTLTKRASTKRAYGWTWLFGKIIRVSPGWFAAEYAVSFVYGVLMAAAPLATEQVFSSVIQFADGKLTLGKVILWLVVLFGLSVFSEIAAGASDYLGEGYAELSMQKLYFTVNEKSGRLPAITFENPQKLNSIQKAYVGAAYSRQFVHSVMDMATMYVPYFILYGWYLYQRRPVLVLIPALIFFPLLAGQILKGTFYSRLEEESAVLQRQKDHYADCAAGRDFAKDTRALGAVGFFLKKYQSALNLLGKKQKKAQQKVALTDSAAALLELAGYAGVLALLLQSVLSGAIEIAAFAAVFASVRTVFEQMEELLGNRAGELAESAAKVCNFLKFLELEEETEEEKVIGDVAHLSAENLSFSYPDGTEALKGVSFEAKKGEMTAIVGENGGGKSTLAKLLAGIYAPSGGTLKINGSAAATGELRSVSSQLFQHYNQYRMTAAENVTVSQAFMADSGRLERVMAQTDIRPSDFPEGWDTMLGREFGGTDLSGGQWQRLAFARALYRPSQILILDEPTAAIDPMREQEMYEAFLNSGKDKIGFIVTHRLGIASACSQILVMKEGRLLDAGSHTKLLARCRYYREMWESQADVQNSKP